MSELRELIKSFDEAALEALANKGLLRRARKDLEESVPQILSETETKLVVQLGEAEVTLPALGPKAATCSCPASGICRHILSAILYLQSPSLTETASEAVAKVAEISVLAEILALELKTIERFAGKATLRQAGELLAKEVIVAEVTATRIVIVVPEHQIQVFLMRGAGLVGSIVRGTSKDEKVEIVAAVLYLRKLYGAELPTLPQESSKPLLKRSVDQVVVKKVQNLLAELIDLGITHLSIAIVERLEALAVATLTADLPRLSLALRSSAEEVRLLLERDAQADELRLLQLLARTNALCEALWTAQTAKPELMGEARSAYTQLTSLTIHAVAAYAWESKSDYHGLTVVFWENQTQEWFTWSEARPKFYSTGFDPKSRYLEGAPWGVNGNLKELAHSSLELTEPRKNQQHRLSNATATQGRSLGRIQPRELNWGKQLFNNWQELANYQTAEFPLGLKLESTLHQVVVLHPSQWGRRAFDPVAQEFFWPLIDNHGATLMLRLAFNMVNESSIAYLEKLDPVREKVWGVVGRVVMTQDDLFFYPYSLLTDHATEAVIHLNLDYPNKINYFQSKKPKLKKDYTEGSLIENTLEFLPLSPVEDLLLRLATCGGKRLESERIRLKELASELRRQSLNLMATALEHLADAERLGSSLLPVVYLAGLHQQAVRKL